MLQQVDEARTEIIKCGESSTVESVYFSDGVRAARKTLQSDSFLYKASAFAHETIAPRLRGIEGHAHHLGSNGDAHYMEWIDGEAMRIKQYDKSLLPGVLLQVCHLIRSRFQAWIASRAAANAVNFDLKPDNLMLSDKRVVEVSLGSKSIRAEVARLITSTDYDLYYDKFGFFPWSEGPVSDRPGFVHGTPQYFSPAQGSGYYGPESELSNIGVIALEKLLGRRLHSGRDSFAIQRSIVRNSQSVIENALRLIDTLVVRYAHELETLWSDIRSVISGLTAVADDLINSGYYRPSTWKQFKAAANNNPLLIENFVEEGGF